MKVSHRAIINNSYMGSFFLTLSCCSPYTHLTRKSFITLLLIYGGKKTPNTYNHP